MMLRKVLPIFVLLNGLFLFCINAQEVVLDTSYLKGKGAYGYDIIETNDGGYALTGSIFTSRKVVLLKLDSQFRYEWHKTYKIQFNNEDRQNRGYKVIQRTGGSFVIAGTCADVRINLNMPFVILTDANGNKKRVIKFLSGHSQAYYSVFKQINNDFLTFLRGDPYDSSYIVRFDSNFNKLKSYSFKLPYGHYNHYDAEFSSSQNRFLIFKDFYYNLKKNETIKLQLRDTSVSLRQRKFLKIDSAFEISSVVEADTNKNTFLIGVNGVFFEKKRPNAYTSRAIILHSAFSGPVKDTLMFQDSNYSISNIDLFQIKHGYGIINRINNGVHLKILNQQLQPTWDTVFANTGYLTFQTKDQKGNYLFRSSSLGLVVLKRLNKGLNTTRNLNARNKAPIKIFPNPVQESFQLVGLPKRQQNETTIKIINARGETMQTLNYQEHETINVSSLKNGVYFISILQQNSVIKTLKMIKQ